MPKHKKILKLFLALGGGRTTPGAMRVALATQDRRPGVAEATPRLNWGGRPPQILFL
jgi:hypothetical protein